MRIRSQNAMPLLLPLLLSRRHGPINARAQSKAPPFTYLLLRDIMPDSHMPASCAEGELHSIMLRSCFGDVFRPGYSTCALQRPDACARQGTASIDTHSIFCNGNCCLCCTLHDAAVGSSHRVAVRTACQRSALGLSDFVSLCFHEDPFWYVW